MMTLAKILVPSQSEIQNHLVSVTFVNPTG